MLSYETVQIVRISDKKLGIIHYAFLTLIIAYVIGYEIIWEMRYVISGTPIGTVRMSLLAPFNRTPARDLAYCNRYNFANNSVPLSPTMQLTCLYLDEGFALLPSEIGDNSLFISTRIDLVRQVLLNNCSLLDETCRYVTEEEEEIFVADVENFTIMLDHFMFSVVPPGQAVGRELAGHVSDLEGNAVEMKTGENIGVQGKFDILRVETVLSAAGVSSLDQSGSYRKNLTMRYEGIVVVVFVNYTNLHSYNLWDLEYFISARIISGAYFKFQQPQYSSDLSNKQRVIWNRHGIRLVVIPTGTYATFDFQVALVTFVSGLGLGAVATMVVDFLATKVMPGKSVYERAKYKDAGKEDEQELSSKGLTERV